MKSYQNIPEELTRLCQWVCFDVEADKKIAYTPGSDRKASSNRPGEWRSFKAACKDVESGKRQHIGFCFASTDPFVFIDLDDPEDPDQKRIMRRFDSYTQWSVSGEGVHIICKGSFKGKGKHPAYPAVGLFKELRFCLMTGDVIDGRSTINLVSDEDLQAVHTHLGGDKGGDPDFELTEYTSDIADMTVVEMGLDRFDKFSALCKGQWEQFHDEYRGDHSIADHAFLGMLCDLTECNAQVRYIFGISGMWNTERAEKKSGHGFEGYVNRTIRKIRSTQEKERRGLERISFPKADEPETLAEVKEVSGKPLLDLLPEGLLKDLALYSYRTSYYPLQEASLCVAVTLLSGIAGRAYLTETMAGLNLWTILVGGTSCGKDELQSGMERVLAALEKRGLSSIGKLLGGELVSGAAMEKVFCDRKRYVSYMPEFGDLFKNITNPFANEHYKTLSRYILNAYKGADLHGTMRARRRAQGVEGEETIERPCLVLVGEATPEALYGGMSSRELETGFLQRFTVVNVPVESWSLHENPEHSKAPPKSLLARLEQLVVHCDSMEVDQRKKMNHTAVPCSDTAREILRQYRIAKRIECRNSPFGLARKETFNRAGLKALRLATLFAVSADFFTPEVTEEHARIAIQLTEQFDSSLLDKFTSGEVGSGQVKQESEVMKAARRIEKMTKGERMKLGISSKVSKISYLIPLFALKEAVVNVPSFANDKLGAVTALEKCVDSMVKSGRFTKIGEALAVEKYDHRKGVLLCINE